MCKKELIVSIIIPVYNVEQYLEECVNSVIYQTYQRLEIILVNDGSTDTSGEICDRFKSTDTRVKVIHKDNGGLSSSREAGMKVVTGDCVMFLDGDDWLDRNTVETCVAEMEGDAEIGCVLFSYAKETETSTIPMQVMDKTRLFTGLEAKDRIHRRMFGLCSDELRHPERMENIVSCCMKLYRTEYARKGRYFDTKEVGSCEDGLFNIYALADCKKILYIDLPMYHYRKRAGSLVKTYKPNFVSQWKRLFEIMAGYIEDNNPGDRYTEALNNRIALSVTAVSLNILQNDSISEFRKIREIRNYLKDDIYRHAVGRTDMSELPMIWRVLLFCSKLKLSLLTYCGMRVVQFKLLR